MGRGDETGALLVLLALAAALYLAVWWVERPGSGEGPPAPPPPRASYRADP